MKTVEEIASSEESSLSRIVRCALVASVLCVAAAMPSLAAVVDLGSGTVEAGPSHGGDAPLRTF